ncbi:hypothetical protein J6590_055342 [Homalodisca vitripennis]|nr:hypothetical protein J6590_055342 [Homalodisca vitripennis]
MSVVVFQRKGQTFQEGCVIDKHLATNTVAAFAALTSATFSVNMRSTAVAVWTTLWAVCYTYAWIFPTDDYLDEKFKGYWEIVGDFAGFCCWIRDVVFNLLHIELSKKLKMMALSGTMEQGIPVDDMCRYDIDQVWRCRKAHECDALSELIMSGELTTCSLANHRNPLVCCPPASNRIAQSISQQKCQEYEERLCYKTLNSIKPNQRLFGRPPYKLLKSMTPVTTNTEEEADWLSEAGEARDQDTTVTPPTVSVYGGEAAWAGEHPHMETEGRVRHEVERVNLRIHANSPMLNLVLASLHPRGALTSSWAFRDAVASTEERVTYFH